MDTDLRFSGHVSCWSMWICVGAHSYTYYVLRQPVLWPVFCIQSTCTNHRSLLPWGAGSPTHIFSLPCSILIFPFNLFLLYDSETKEYIYLFFSLLASVLNISTAHAELCIMRTTWDKMHICIHLKHSDIIIILDLLHKLHKWLFWFNFCLIMFFYSYSAHPHSALIHSYLSFIIFFFFPFAVSHYYWPCDSVFPWGSLTIHLIHSDKPTPAGMCTDILGGKGSNKKKGKNYYHYYYCMHSSISFIYF